MKFRKPAIPESGASREDVRQIAETISLYRSAMHHLAGREAAQPFPARPRPARTLRLRLLLAPALAAALAAILIPVFSHRHDAPKPAPLALTGQHPPELARATVDDTALMNQIDSELSEDVPDALQPLADLSDPTTTTHSVSEKKNVTQN